MVTPSYMLTLLDEFERQGVDPRSTSLRVGIFGAEPWTEQMRREIEERVGHRRGRHLRPVRGDRARVSRRSAWRPRTACTSGRTTSTRRSSTRSPTRSCRAGESGELVFTSLTKEALPVIRYRTRDLTRLLPGTARPAFRRMEKVTGRCDDMIILRGVNVFPSQVEEIVLRTPGVAPHFRIELTRKGRMDHMAVYAEARADTPADVRRAGAEAIARGIKDGVGVTVEVRIVDPETLERSVGKIQRVKDLRAR